MSQLGSTLFQVSNQLIPQPIQSPTRNPVQTPQVELGQLVSALATGLLYAQRCVVYHVRRANLWVFSIFSVSSILSVLF